MADARNEVINGDYKSWRLLLFRNRLYIYDSSQGVSTKIELDNKQVKRYEVIDADARKSVTSGILRAGAGAVVLGPIGLAAGLSAKRKVIYTLSLEFYDGKRSLIEVNEKFYKKIIQDIF